MSMEIGLMAIRAFLKGSSMGGRVTESARRFFDNSQRAKRLFTPRSPPSQVVRPVTVKPVVKAPVGDLYVREPTMPPLNTKFGYR